MALMMPDRHYVSHGRYWVGGTNRMPLCYMPLLFVPVVAAPDNVRETRTKPAGVPKCKWVP